MFIFKRMTTIITIRRFAKSCYPHIQTISINRTHHTSSFTSTVVHKYPFIYSQTRYKCYRNHSRISPYYHSTYKFTVTPLETDGTLSLLQYGDKQIYLIGTAHISTKSADQVRKVIQQIKPDTVFVELCPTRAEKIWAKIRENQENPQKDLAPLTSEEWLEELPFAKRFKDMNQRLLKYLEMFGFVYGGEFYAALEEAEAINAKIVYGDRNVKETMNRLNDGLSALWSNMFGNVSKSWQDSRDNLNQKQIEKNWHTKSDDGKRETFGKREDEWSWFNFGFDNEKYKQYENMSFWDAMKKGWDESKQQRAKMGTGNWSEIWGLFTNPEATIEAMKDRNKIREKFAQLKQVAPELVKGLVEERDTIMANNLKKCEGKIIVAVVGIGHMDGMEEYFKTV